MKPSSEIANITVHSFLKNIKNFPALFAAFDMLETNYFSQNTFYQVINKAKIQFINEIKPTLNFIDSINNRTFVNQQTLNNFDTLFLVKRTIDSFESGADPLLKITKQKLNEITDFLVNIRNNFSAIDFPELHKEQIRQEIALAMYELFPPAL